MSAADDEVRVYSFGLDVAEAGRHGLAALLSEDERERAARIAIERVRRRFVAVRARVRQILGARLDVDPAELRFATAPGGKPELRALPGSPDLHFNLSHSRDRALLAVAEGRAVGVDVERVRSGRDLDGIARRFFAPGEVEALEEMAGPERVEAFYRCWTRKEAVLKAVGRGLRIPLEQVEVSVRPGEPPRLVSTGWDPSERERWSLVDLCPPPGFAAALAAAGDGWRAVSGVEPAPGAGFTP